MDTGGDTLTVLTIDPADGEYCLTQEYDDGSTSIAAWHGCIIEAGLGQYRPDQDEARAYLASDEAVALVQRVLDGHTLDWDGSNWIGHLTDDADAALEALVDDLRGLTPCDWRMEAVDDWCSEAACLITADTPDQRINELVDDLQEFATEDHVILYGDMLANLLDVRQEERDRRDCHD